MKPSSVFFAENLKFLRERRKMTQQELSEKLGITRVRLNSLENGHTKTPHPTDYIEISDFFRVSIDVIIRVNLAKAGELALRQLEAGREAVLRGDNLRILALTTDQNQNENVEYVPVKAQAGYQAGYKDPEFIAALPKLTLPNLPPGTFRVFPITGDSMLPIPGNSDITGKYVADWLGLRPGTPCIVILKNEQELVFKMVTIRKETVLLESLNPAFEPYEVGLEEVLEIWKFHSFATTSFPAGNPDPGELFRILLKEMRAITGKPGL
ncbi:hypothetical protein GCM10023091_36010 [Ravibacter arvi]|uniref:HTH cro/C1-type domain-containing protein n=1 Tax=Ravibacter arvi TaxID=2051041 RepID=A0ABP8M615_9BACT